MKNNEMEKRRNHRQNSSKLVKTDPNTLISLETQKPFVSLPERRQAIDIQQNFREEPFRLGNDARHLSSFVVKTSAKSLKSQPKRFADISRHMSGATSTLQGKIKVENTLTATR